MANGYYNIYKLNIYTMEKSLKGTRTEQNLLKAFAGESQARNRYEFFASQARKEGYEQIADMFQETATHEKAHAKRFFKFLEGGMTEITASYPAGKIGTTKENLKASAEGENEEWTKLYPMFAEIAREEGFPEVAMAFKSIAKVEAEHERRYLKLLQDISEDQVFMKNGKVWWMCINCGYVYESEQALEICPACQHPKAFMKIRSEII
jgi:rubrerythrin